MVAVFHYFKVFRGLKMTSRKDKENESTKQTRTRSKIPILTARPAPSSWASKVFSDHQSDKLLQRRPLSNIQAIGHDGGRSYFEFSQNVRKSPPKGKNGVQLKQDELQTKIPPKGAIYTSTLGKSIAKKSVLDKTKNVTVRKDVDSPLDWSFKALLDVKKPNISNQNNFTVNNYEQGNKNEAPEKLKPEKDEHRIVRSKSEDPLLRLPKPLTPIQIPIGQHNRVKNIKRSLKRPHSRELQTRTSSEIDFQPEAAPLIIKDLALSTKVLNAIELFQRVDPYSGNFRRELTAAYEKGIISYLFSIQPTESEQHGPPRISAMTRSIVVNWLIKVNGSQGAEASGPQVVQSAVNFLDRVLALDSAPLERVQLLAAACYWIAQKQSAKPKSATQFVKHAAGAYTPRDLRAAERYVLRKLNWPLLPVVTDDFVPYLTQKCSPGALEPLTTAATFLCTAALLDSDLSALPPSVLAAAAVSISLLLLDEPPTKRSQLKLSSVYRLARQNRKFNEISNKLVRAVRVLSDPQCCCREPFLLFSRSPYKVAEILAQKLSSLIAENRFLEAP